jgi:Uma2 family endonuclease
VAIGLKKKLDYDDYCAIPPDGKRYELIEGLIHVTPAPSPLHQRVSKRLQRLLEAYFEESGRGEVFDAPIDVILTPHDVVQPDLVVVTDPALVSRRGIEAAPTLVVEVLSPATASYDRTAKAQRYATLGVPHYWLVDLDTRILECFRSRESAYYPIGSFGRDETLTHPDFPGLRLELALLWR